MAVRTILNVIGVDTAGDRDLKLTAGLCRETDAHLSAFVIAFAAPPPIGDYVIAISPAWMEERQKEIKRLDRRTEAVTSFLAGTEISADVVNDYPELAWASDVIARRARYADLTVVGPDLLKTETLKEKTLEGALFLSGKPVLLVPDGVRATLKPQRVLVAWDARTEASRAVRESLDILAAAADVRLVLVDPKEGATAHGDEPGADAAAYLVRHGVKVTVERLPRSGHRVDEILRKRAADMSAELMVMGAYGHSRLRERIFGGVTRSMLEDVPLPILMAR